MKVAPIVALVVLGCGTQQSYVDPDGPRYAADYTGSTRGEDDAYVRLVSYNVKFGVHVDEAIAVLSRRRELTDVVCLQEMDGAGVDRIARALGWEYVYYAATRRKSGRDFGNAVLTRGRILADEKVVLPHANPLNRQRRIAVLAMVEVEGLRVQVVSAHLETPYLSPEARSDQVQAILDAVDEGPCVVAGDFNTLANDILFRFDGLFEEAGFTRATADVGSTLKAGPLRFRADHVYVRGLEVVAAGKFEGAVGSDHLPVWVELHRALDAEEPRHIVVGRANWLVFASPRGGEVACRLY